MVSAFGVTDPGPVRKNNEDWFISDEQLRLFVVADGMGGHNAGEVASRLAVEAIRGFIHRSAEDRDFSWPYGIDPNLSYESNRLRTAIGLANRRVFRTAESHDDYTGMGTTVVGVLISDARMVVGHVGDSRLYRAANGDLRCLTRDDSWVAKLVADDPRLDPAEHPMRHALTNVVGAHERADIHIAEHDLQGGETLLLCSDGLHGVLDDSTIHELMTADDDVEGVARSLVAAALERGTRDNVTALVVRVERKR
ncbi:MAG: serine/threonine-protein phosphatase [Acidobacteria bacterium]|nr:serine/threonine-protein phosphatase [Acidobacteriota bacterium]